MSFPSKRFAYNIISDYDPEAATEAVNHHTSQGWRVRQMSIDPDGKFVFLLEMKFDLRGKQPLSRRLAAEARASRHAK